MRLALGGVKHKAFDAVAGGWRGDDFDKRLAYDGEAFESNARTPRVAQSSKRTLANPPGSIETTVKRNRSPR
ncbi:MULTISPECIES: hypothetical protein [Burkholderia]|nr:MULTISPECIES: hypothetical protein [Burkholderia]KGS01313.1 hypothetical protein X946_3676 [Burkholderia sp. ABCPW 111]